MIYFHGNRTMTKTVIFAENTNIPRRKMFLFTKKTKQRKNNKMLCMNNSLLVLKWNLKNSYVAYVLPVWKLSCQNWGEMGLNMKIALCSVWTLYLLIHTQPWRSNSNHKAALTSLFVYALFVRLASHCASQSALKPLGSAFSFRWNYNKKPEETSCKEWNNFSNHHHLQQILRRCLLGEFHGIWTFSWS